MRIVYTISPCLLYVYVSKLLALFHHIVCMFMYPHLCTISPCILIVRVMYPYLYAISPYRLVCLCIHVFTLFHHIAMFMYPRYLHYFTIHMCLCIHVFVLFHHIYQSYMLCIQTTHTISPHKILHVYVSIYTCFRI